MFFILKIISHELHFRFCCDILPLFLTQEGLKKWNDESGSRKLMERIKERWFYFKKIELINLKVAIARIVYR